MAGSCPNCSADLGGHSCKLRCPRCGYFESCSDLEPHPPLRADRVRARGTDAIRAVPTPARQAPTPSRR